jgi:hypothetical protein
MKTIKVYLAGGMKSSWQQKIINSCNGLNFEFINPQQHGLDIPSQYTHWDLFGVKNCDILFGYMEEINPSGFGLSAEIGYAKAQGKLIILADEKSPRDERFKRMFAMINNIADVRFDNLYSAIDYLKTYNNIYYVHSK